MLRYALDNLGWFEFEQLIQTLLKFKLAVGVEAWGGHGDLGRDAYFSGTLPYPTNGGSPGPFLFQCKFVESANAAGAKPESLLVKAVRKECDRIAERLKPLGGWDTSPKHYVLFTNAPVTPTVRSQVEAMLNTVMPTCAVHIHDGNDVCQWLNTTREIVRSFPQLLSLRDLTDLLRDFANGDIVARSETAIEMGKAEAKVFIPIGAYFQALQVLQKHFFVVLEGPPEMGKTTIGRMIALAQLAQGWDVIECRIPEDFLRTYSKDARQVFVCDDFFGRTEYDPGRVSIWQADLPHIIRRLNSQHWLILTSRAHLFEMARPSLDVAGYNDQFPKMGEVVVNAGTLSKAEKARILYRHAKAANLDGELKSIVKAEAKDIIANKHFTPERIRRLVAIVLPETVAEKGGSDRPTIKSLVKEALSNPTKQMRATFRALLQCHRWFLYALLESEESSHSIIIDGPHADASTLQKRYEALCPPEQQKPFNVVAEEMSEAFIKHSLALFGGTSIGWIHPSCRDLTIDELSANRPDRTRFLSLCSEKGVQLATSVGGGASGLRELPLLSTPDDWRILKERCIELMNDGHNILGIVWHNHEALVRLSQTTPGMNVRAELLRGFVAQLLPFAASALENPNRSFRVPSLEDFFVVRQATGVNVTLDLTELWKNCIEDAEASLPEDTVIWQCIGPDGFCGMLDLIKAHEPSFFEKPWVQESLKSVIELIRNRGESECDSFYLEDSDPSDFKEEYDGYKSLEKSYRWLAESGFADPEDSKALREAATHFSIAASRLEDEAPSESDSDDYGAGSHSPTDIDIDQLFSDL